VRVYAVGDWVLHQGTVVVDTTPLFVRMVQETVFRDIWEPNGGDCDDSPDHGSFALVVSAPSETHSEMNGCCANCAEFAFARTRR